MKSLSGVVHHAPTVLDLMSALYKDRIGLKDPEIRENLALYDPAVALAVIP